MYPQQNPIAALSSIYGLQQQQVDIAQKKQALQTGAIQQQTAQAESTQKQQQNAELQAAQSVVKNGVAAGRYNNPDGSFNRQKAADDITTVAPTYGQGISNQLLSGANEVVQNKQALQNLNQSQRAQIGGVVSSLAADPNIDNTKVIDAFNGLIDQNPDPGFRRLVLSNLAHMPQTGKPADLQQALSTMSAGLTGQSPVGAGTNAAGQNQVVNTLTGARNAPTLGPGTSNPASPQVAGQTSAATLPYVGPAAAAAASGSSRAGGAGNADILASNNVVAGQRDARTNIDLTTRIDQLADIVAPGALPAKVSAGLGALGLQDVTQARTELQKDLGRLRGPLADRAASDGRAGELLAGLPTDTTPTQTIHQAMDVQRGAAKQDLALGALRDKTAAATGGNMNGFQSQYSHAVGVASPLMHEYWSLPKADQAAFLKRNSSSPQQAQELRNRFEAARSQLNVGQ